MSHKNQNSSQARAASQALYLVLIIQHCQRVIQLATWSEMIQVERNESALARAPQAAQLLPVWITRALGAPGDARSAVRASAAGETPQAGRRERRAPQVYMRHSFAKIELT